MTVLLLFFWRESSISRLPYSDVLFILLFERVFVFVFHKIFKMRNLKEADQSNLLVKHGQ